jgi:epoxide hydrolase
LANPDIPLTGPVEKLLVMNAALRCSTSEIDRFQLGIPGAALRRLAVRLGRERAVGEAWQAAAEYGAPLGLLEALLEFWCDELDFAALERRLNQTAHFRTTVHGQRLCFMHARAAETSALPLLWLHGYSGSLVEVQRIVAPLTTSAGRGAQGAFHVVAPSLPGFGLSDANYEPNLHNVAKSCAELMAQLGYERYAVHGSDLGAAIAVELARLDSSRVAGVHVTALGSLPSAEPFELASLTSDEKSRLASASDLASIWAHAAPETAVERLALATCQLADFEAANELESFRELLLWGLSLSWLGGDREFQRLLAERALSPSTVRSDVPLCLCSFPLAAPTLRRFAERDHRIVDWQEQPRGGDLAALEQPEVLLQSLRAFFSRYR